MAPMGCCCSGVARRRRLLLLLLLSLAPLTVVDVDVTFPAAPEPRRPCCLSMVSLSLLAKLSAAAEGGDSSRSGVFVLVKVLFKDLGFGLGAEDDEGVEDVEEDVEEDALLVVGKSRTRSGVCFFTAGKEEEEVVVVSFCFQNSLLDLTTAPG